MAVILNVKEITWDITDDDLVDNPGELPPTSFQIELSDDYVKEIILEALEDVDNYRLTSLIESVHPFCYEDLYFTVEVKPKPKEVA